MVHEQSVCFITGCSTVIRAALAKYAHKAGDSVVTMARNPQSLSHLPDALDALNLGLDVTFSKAVIHAIEAAVPKFGRLDLIVNNAGYAVQGDTEAVATVTARAEIESSFWGTANVTTAVLTIIREINPINPPGKGGFFIQISSMGGRLVIPGHGYYHAMYALLLKKLMCFRD